jgi:hypothetical protein
MKGYEVVAGRKVIGDRNVSLSHHISYVRKALKLENSFDEMSIDIPHVNYKVYLIRIGFRNYSKGAYYHRMTGTRWVNRSGTRFQYF